MKTFKTTGLALIVLLAMTVLSIGCPNVSGVKPTDSGNSGAGIGGGETTPPIPVQYVQVPYEKLEEYLQNTASSEKVNYIEVTGEIPVADFTGSGSNPGALGKKLKKHSGKKIALKIASYPAGLTDIRWCFSGCESLTTAPAIPESVTDIRWCFEGCESLTAAPDIPESVTDMAGCFKGCKNLTTAPDIPKGVTNMHSCFKGCKNLTTAPDIPKGVTNIHSCFQDCESLTAAPAIPEGVTNMGWCFRGCKSLTTAPVIPEGVTDMSDCFGYCESLTTAPAIPESVTNMGWCFTGCKSLTAAPDIPKDVTDMYSCFQGCESLTTAPAIPKGVTNMHSCFSGCTNLKTVTLKCDYNPAEILGAQAFKNTFKGCTALIDGGIKVPAAYYGAYTADTALNMMDVPGGNVEQKRAKFAAIP